ncbi:hypothetical protein [Ruegeria arenilitoris]|uniref:hypothetical protein n=1 Tax=Ruegeria arenilitoris TaxID=1173585 RepID=UPI00147A1054|nr:hypothetical protein [Ruegeria arenilitoris]
MPYKKLHKISAICCAAAILGLAACSPTPAKQDYASENTISFRYSAYDSVPTLTAEAQDKAAKHCAKYGKHANYKGGNAVSPISTEEIHTFACESVKTDDSLIIAKQSERPDVLIYQTPVYQPAAATSYGPVYTSCSMYGNMANCTSF